MRSQKSLIGLAAAWVLFIVFDSITGILGAWYVRKMAIPVKSTYKLAKHGRTFFMFVAIVLNLFMLLNRSSSKGCCHK